MLDFYVGVPNASGYANGDFNYDGFIDAGDYGLLDYTIEKQGAQIPTSGSDAGAAGVTAVPEPGACGFAAVAAGLLLRRRRRA